MLFKTSTGIVYELKRKNGDFVITKIASDVGEEYEGDKIIITEHLELLDNGRPTLRTSPLDFSSFQL